MKKILEAIQNVYQYTDILKGLQENHYFKPFSEIWLSWKTTIYNKSEDKSCAPLLGKAGREGER